MTGVQTCALPISAINKVIELPDTIEVCLYKFAKNVYGGIDLYRVNRIGINYDLLLQDVPLILTHELIHVHQKHTRVFKTDKNNFYWHGILQNVKSIENLSFEEYENLPWEIDVRLKQMEVFKKALSLIQQ